MLARRAASIARASRSGSNSPVVLHERRSLPKAAAKAIQKQRDHIDEGIDGILREGIDDGTIRPASVVLTRLAVTGMTNWAYTWFDATGSLSADEISDHFVDILRNGLAGPSVSATP